MIPAPAARLWSQAPGFRLRRPVLRSGGLRRHGLIGCADAPALLRVLRSAPGRQLTAGHGHIVFGSPRSAPPPPETAPGGGRPPLPIVAVALRSSPSLRAPSGPCAKPPLLRRAVTPPSPCAWPASPPPPASPPLPPHGPPPLASGEAREWLGRAGQGQGSRRTDRRGWTVRMGAVMEAEVSTVTRRCTSDGPDLV